MQAVTTIGLDIARSVFQQRAHPLSVKAPLCRGVLSEAAAVPGWH